MYMPFLRNPGFEKNKPKKKKKKETSNAKKKAQLNIFM